MERTVDSLAIEERLDQPVVADAVIGVHEEHAQEATLHGTAYGNGTVRILRVDPTQHGEVHADHPLARAQPKAMTRRSQAGHRSGPQDGL